MEKFVLTTPFGRRPVMLGQIAAQLEIQHAVKKAGQPGSNHPPAVNKWQLFRTLTEVRGKLGVSDRALSVLNALLTFHPETALSLPQPLAGSGKDEPAEDEADPSCDLVVFPSNKTLALRAHGMKPATLWRHLTALVDAGLLQRRDSPNGKRYARKAEQGAAERFSHAYGFDLTPLVARAPEFEALAEVERRDDHARKLLKEKISLLRRDTGKLLALGLDEGLRGPWEDHQQQYLALMTPLRRIAGDAALRQLAEDLAALRDAVTLDLSKCLKSENNDKEMKCNATQNEEHESKSKTQIFCDSEPASEKEGEGVVSAAGTSTQSHGTFTLGLIMEACPDAHEYAESGRVRSWPEFLDTAERIRSMLGISPDAWAAARATLGHVEAHIAVATILQRSEHSNEAMRVPGSTKMLVNGSPAIRSPGGYLRALTEQGRASTFKLGPVLMALIGQRLKMKQGMASTV